jgi:hypothetical protein
MGEAILWHELRDCSFSFAHLLDETICPVDQYHLAHQLLHHALCGRLIILWHDNLGLGPFHGKIHDKPYEGLMR